MSDRPPLGGLPPATVPGLLLAAGAGRRMGGPKALRLDRDGHAWVQRGCRVLAEGGCDPVLVAVGAASVQVRELVPRDATVIEVTDWEAGMGASLRAGLDALPSCAPSAQLALITLVDLPGLGADVVARVRRAALAQPDPSRALLRAAYAGEPGHPVVLGRSHWSAAATSAVGDRGARAYLARREVTLVECGDIGGGQDIDTPAEGPAT